MIANLAHQTPLITPNPLGVPVMFTSDVLMLPKIFNYPIKRVLANMDIGILRNLLCDCLVCHGNKSVLVPKWAVA